MHLRFSTSLMKKKDFYPSVVIQPLNVTQKGSKQCWHLFQSIFLFVCVVCVMEILWTADILSGQTRQVGKDETVCCKSASSEGTQVEPEKDKQAQAV